MNELANMPAFPCEVTWGIDGIQGRQTGSSSGISPGMTLRQYFAGLAMQGLLANPEHHNYYNRLEKEGTSKQKIAEWKSARAVLYADALIAELEKQP